MLVLGGLEPGQPLVAVELCRVGFGKEAFEDGDEAAGALLLGDVAGVLEDLEVAAGEGGVGLAAVVDGDDRVVLAPDDEDREGVGEVELVEGGDALALHADDRAQGGDEGLAALGIGEGRVAAGDFGDVGVGTEADEAEAAADDGADPAARRRRLPR